MKKLRELCAAHWNPIGVPMELEMGAKTLLERFPIILRHSLQRRSSWYTLRV